ncbi:hypothetical protein GOA61_28360 [Sinorhizobium meliloti]|nr:hypothetical protein [Sinorhizobium meliloti]MDW9881265.1 hypothetical protein [Sinorhizobium meliloti]
MVADNLLRIASQLGDLGLRASSPEEMRDDLAHLGLALLRRSDLRCNELLPFWRDEDHLETLLLEAYGAVHCDRDAVAFFDGPTCGFWLVIVLRLQIADSDEAAPLFRDDCAPGFRDDLAPCLVGSAGDDCCQFIQARCQALRGRFRRRLSPLNSMRWALWTNLSSMASA